MYRVVLVFAIACGGTDDTIDRTFDPCSVAVHSEDARAGAIDDALALWNLDTAASVPIDLRFEAAAPSFHGHYDDESGVIFINDGIHDPRVLAIVIAHELGHAFGLPHISGRASIMNRGNLGIAPTAEDFAALDALWGVTSSCARPRS